MEKNATSSQLIQAFEDRLKETEEHVTRLEGVFKSLGLKAVAKKCVAMAELLDEAQGIIEETKVQDVRDDCRSAKLEHYEIATYGTFRVYAVTLGETKAALLLAKTLEEKNADVKLTEIAVSHISMLMLPTKTVIK